MNTLAILLSLMAAGLPPVNGLTVYLLASNPTCPPQVFLDPAACPVALDLTKIAVDPYEKKPCLLAWKLVPEGTQWQYDGHYCDPESDLMTITAAGAGNFMSRPDGTYLLTDLAGSAGTIVYATMTLTDKPPAGDAITRKGTVAIISTKKNNPPSLY